MQIADKAFVILQNWRLFLIGGAPQYNWQILPSGYSIFI